jgi:hypothetical protein
VHCGADERAPGKKIRAGRAATAAGTALLHRQLLAPARRRTGGKIGRPRGGQAPSEQPSARASQSRRRQPPEGFAHGRMPAAARGGPVGRGVAARWLGFPPGSPRGRRHGGLVCLPPSKFLVPFPNVGKHVVRDIRRVRKTRRSVREAGLQGRAC